MNYFKPWYITSGYSPTVAMKDEFGMTSNLERGDQGKAEERESLDNDEETNRKIWNSELMRAVLQEDIPAIENALKKGANPNQRLVSGMSLIEHAGLKLTNGLQIVALLTDIRYGGGHDL